MSEEKKLSENELKGLMRIEYEQICADWRHRDNMLWQSLAVAITLTGGAFSVVFNRDTESTGKIIISFLAFILNVVLLLKITKDHYYELGSSELLLDKLGSRELIKNLNIGMDVETHSLRIYTPSKIFFEKFEDSRQGLSKELVLPLYKQINKGSAFEWFFIIQLLLVFITLISSLWYLFVPFVPIPLFTLLILIFTLLCIIYLFS